MYVYMYICTYMCTLLTQNPIFNSLLIELVKGSLFLFVRISLPRPVSLVDRAELGVGFTCV